ncbi:MAG TPA: VanZ family protein [Candidatus Gallacutalibacter stercoravium]|nr:VanZ family protein [Candidatus Gallacutalibacter stercoravium]
MKDKSREAIPHLTTAQTFTSAAGGVALYLAPQDAINVGSGIFREGYVMLLAAIITALLLFLFKSYAAVGCSLMVSMVFVLLRYLMWSVDWVGNRLEQGEPFTLSLNSYEGICWGLIWMVPFVLCLLLRLTGPAFWETRERHLEFCAFFRLACYSFGVYYFILFLVGFVFPRTLNLTGAREIELLPLAQIKGYFTGENQNWLYLLGNLFFFLPVGFYLNVRRPTLRWWQNLPLALAVSLAVELLQLALNTSAARVDDVLLNVAGFFIGVLLKRGIDALRRFFSGGVEQRVAYLVRDVPPAESYKIND